MKEKTLDKIVSTSKPFMEEGENVKAAVRAIEGPAWAMFFGAVGMLLFTKQRIVLVTDRNVYVMNGDRMTGNSAKGLVAKHARGTVRVAHERGKAFDKIVVGDTSMLIGKLFKKDAAAVAEASA